VRQETGTGAFFNQHSFDIVSELRHSLILIKPSGWSIMFAIARQTDNRRRYSHHIPPWYNPQLSARSGPDPLGGYCHSSHIRRQTGENPCGLTLTFPPTDRTGPVRLFRRGNAGLEGRRHQRQTRGLELAAENKTGKLQCDYSDENSYLIFRPDTPTTNPCIPLATPDVLDIVITKNVTSPCMSPRALH